MSFTDPREPTPERRVSLPESEGLEEGRPTRTRQLLAGPYACGSTGNIDRERSRSGVGSRGDITASTGFDPAPSARTSSNGANLGSGPSLILLSAHVCL